MIDYKAKAEEMKELYTELRNLRIDSVKIDIEDLKEKIKEHKKIHQLSIEEIRKYNLSLENKIHESKNVKNSLTSLQSSILKSKRELSLKDPTLAKVFSYDSLHLLDKNKNNYLIGKGKNDEFQFVLTKTNSGYTYQGYHVPHDISSDKDISEWVESSIEFTDRYLDKLLHLCANATFRED